MKNVIYKITSPSNRVYIGQSMNYKQRLAQYMTMNVSIKTQPRLYQSLLKYTPKNHTFEIIEECEFEELNMRERYWQEYYDVIGPNGLNCMLTKTNEKKRVVSEETKKAISESLKGKKRNKEQIKNMSLSKKGDKNPMYGLRGELSPNYGRNMTEYTKNKIFEANRRFVLDTSNGVFYESIKEASTYYNINYGTLRDILTGRIKNKTPLIKV